MKSQRFIILSFLLPIALLVLSYGATNTASSASDIPTVDQAENPSKELIQQEAQIMYVSPTGSGSVRGVSAADEDILIYDENRTHPSTAPWGLYFDPSEFGITVDVNALLVLTDSILLSFESAVTLPDVGPVTASDIVRFVPTTIGDTTAGQFELYFDGSDVELTTSNENINAIAIAPDGRLLLSTVSSSSVTGLTFTENDIVAFTPTQLGQITSGTWEIYFDGSDIGLSGTSEDITGMWVDQATDEIYLTTASSFDVEDISGTSTDIFVCEPGTLGEITGCANFRIFFDGSEQGLPNGTPGIDSFSLLLHDGANSPTLYLSLIADTTLGLLDFAREDIIGQNRETDRWELYFDGSDMGITANLNAFLVLTDSILMSFDTTVTLPGVGNVAENDIVRFIPTITGERTAGHFEWYFDGSDVELTTTSEDIDAIAIAPDGRLLISTVSSGSVTGVSSFVSQQLIAFTPTELGETTSGTWEMYFDGPDLELDTSNENIVAAWVDSATEDVYLATLSSFSTSIGFAGDGADIFICDPFFLGNTTLCSFSMFFDGSEQGLAGYTVDGFSLASDISMPASESTPEGIHVSMNLDGVIGGLSADDEDIVRYDEGANRWNYHFDGSDLGLNTGDINALLVLTDSSILISFETEIILPDLGTVATTDIVRVIPSSTGERTLGHFEWYLDGSDIELDSASENIDAIAIAPDGRLLISTTGSASVTGVSSFAGEDIIAFAPTQLGETTSGTWEIYFDGSDVRLFGSAENIVDVWVDSTNNQIYLTTSGAFSVLDLTGDASDIFVCTPLQIGSVTNCVFHLYFDGSEQGILSNQVVDAFSLLLDEGASTPTLYLSTASDTTVGRISFANEDILYYDIPTKRWEMYFDGSDVGVTGELYALLVLTDSILISFGTSIVNLPDVGEVTGHDIIRFVPTSTGETTAGHFEWYFDGSDVELTASGEWITAIAMTSDGRLLVSPYSSGSVTGLSFVSQDIIAFTPTQLGATTRGTWEMYFDGSDVALTENSEEFIWGAWFDHITDEVYLSTLSSFSVSGASGDRSDIFVYTPGGVGDVTAGVFRTFFDGSVEGIPSGHIVDGISLVTSPSSETSIPKANITVLPSQFSFGLAEGESVADTLVISNTGTSELDWTISSDASWLTTVETSGTVAPDGSQNVTFNIDSADLTPSNYNGRVTINSNDPDQPSVEVAVDLTVSASFRTIDGTENNLSNSTYGSVNSQLLRSWDSPSTGGVINTPSDYGDGISTPAGAERPSARAVSNEVAAQLELVPNLLGASDFLWQWGQFVDHDMDLTGVPEVSPEGFNIEVPLGDSFFDPTSSGTAVITFTRSVFDEATGTALDNPRQQINQITAWIDGSQVYGSDLVIAEWKRTFEGGKLKSSAGNLLPLKEQSETEFTAGDMRANEQIGLTALHTLFMREHNRLADLIAAANPGMSDEDIFQRVRAIVGAQIQQITYNEFLPLLLGADGLPAYTGYNDQINPNISNAFSTGSFRFGHTMLSPTLLRFDENGDEISNGHVPLRAAFFNPQLIIEDGIDPILRGLGMQQAQAVDPLLIDDVRNLLFGPPGSGGSDLAALNIQRGRDHGLASYKAVREALGLGSVSSFADITSDVERQNALAAVYNNDVNQVDLWVGGLAEDHAEGALVGPTFQAIIADQFMRLRDGDRFWHSHLDWSAYGFAADPLLHENGTTLSDVKLSDIIRWNTAISNIQDHVFLVSTLEVGQSVSSPVAEAGDRLTYQIVLTTTASNTNATVIDRLPAGLTYVADSVTGGATFADGQIRYDGPVSADNPHSISYQATVDSNLADGTILYSTALATWQGMPLEDMVTVVIEDLTVEHTLVLLYVNGDNDLSESMLELVNKAEFAAGNPDATVLLLLDGPDDEGAYLYRLQEDFDAGCPNYINPTCDGRYVMGQNLWEWDENIASPSSLSEFLIGAKRAYPETTQIALSLAGHGGGWAPTTLDAQPMGYSGLSGGPGGLLWDEHRRLSLSTRELGEALSRFERKTGSKIDLLFLDACLMGMSEVAYEVRDTVDYLLASESWSWTSFTYDDHLNAITSETNAREIGEAWLANEASVLRDDDYPFTYSLMDLSQMTTLRQAQDNLADELIGVLPNGKAKIDAAFEASACFDSDGNGQIIQPNNNPDALPLDYYCDLHSFAEQLKAEFSDQSTLVEAAQALQDTIATAVLTEDHNNGIPWRYSEQYWRWDQLGGLSGYLPLVTDHFNRRYYTRQHLRSAKDGQWDEFLKAYWNTSPPDDPECPPEGCHLPPGPLPIAPITLNGSTSQDSIALSWTPGEAFASPLDHYDLYRSADNGSSYSLIASLPESEYSDNDATLTQGSDYCYQIKALDSASEVIGESNVPCLSLTEPTGTSLTCSVTFQDPPAAPDARWINPLRGSLTIPGASEPAYTFTPTSDENGRFTLSNLEPGDYELRLKKNTTLENLLNITIAEGDNSLNCGTLLEGDATDDNFVAIADFAVLADAFGTCEGDPTYDERADFNNDNCVALADFGLLADNFGKGGPIIVEPTQ